MASLLDANLYTLLIRLSPSDPKSLTQLIEPSRGSEVRYLRYRGRLDNSSSSSSNNGHSQVGEVDPTVAFGGYDASLVDAYTGVRLASCSSAQPSYKAKSRRLELHNPDMSIPFEFSGSLGFEWQFTYEDRQFKWSRPAFGSDYVCAIDRKPDPSVQVCMYPYKEHSELKTGLHSAKPPSKGKDGVIQLLDYNLARFDFQDLKGLELALYMSLLSIIDAAEDKISSRKDGSPPGPSRPTSTAPPTSLSSTPAVPVRAEGATSPDDLSLQALSFNADPNEVYIPATGPLDPHVAHCVDLLRDESMLFVVLRSAAPEAVRRIVEAADGVKRARHRMGLDQEGRGLYQYVVEDEVKRGGHDSGRGPRVIKLDDTPSRKQEKPYTPPQSIAIYLSKIDLPELQPKTAASTGSQAQPIANQRSAGRSLVSNGPHLAQGPRLPPKISTDPQPGLAPSRVPEQRRHSQTSSTPASGQATESINDKSAGRISRLFRSKS